VVIIIDIRNKLKGSIVIFGVKKGARRKKSPVDPRDDKRRYLACEILSAAVS